MRSAEEVELLTAYPRDREHIDTLYPTGGVLTFVIQSARETESCTFNPRTTTVRKAQRNTALKYPSLTGVALRSENPLLDEPLLRPNGSGTTSGTPLMPRGFLAAT